MKKIFVLILILIFPSRFVRIGLRLLGCKIGKNVKFGFSIVFVDHIEIGDNSVIGHLNLIINNGMLFESDTKIGYLNVMKGPFDLILKDKGSIGNKNYFTRGRKGVSYGEAQLTLGILTKITVGHHLDLTRSISIGDYSILAGLKSQLWTHGYFHESFGPRRIRIDGEIAIGNNVYIGSMCLINPGVCITNAVNIGSGSVVSKDIKKSGMYVGQALRVVDTDINSIEKKLKKVVDVELVEVVYSK